MRYVRGLIAVSVLGLAGCLGAGSMGDEPGDDSDAGGATGFADASTPPISADAAPEPDAPTKPDAAPETVTATVDIDPAECLFMLEGPAPTYARLECIEDEAPWCNFLGQVCMDYATEVDVLGPAEIYTGSELADACPENNWFPVRFRDYQGYSCGYFLDFGGQAPPT